ncbi:beta-ketoacyl synthase N-terminal-like domain-containing protein [Sphingobacterium sp. LRF_L2]|uniref:beta-ketoacyl synthase N-terminal-like domain-containing protein n=1 Tax=Sphingobacterium sp. LRF_L2 TaxID=3369421 RepID=UPI003F6451F5
MKASVFINGIGAVTAQGIWRPSLLAEAKELNRPISDAVQPVYKDIIAPAMIRRMSKGIKMGIFAAQQALDEAGLTLPDAIITGTGLGCSEDSEKFLRAILDNDEQFLTPTSFIQSTHNTVAAQIALRLGCKGYNFTYVNRSVSFESALLDALLQLQSSEATDILLGGVDEISDHTYLLLQKIGYIKSEGVFESVKESRSPGVNYAEGAAFFSLSSSRSQHSYAAVVDVIMQNIVEKGDVSTFVGRFLKSNAIDASQVDALLLGYCGDQDDDYYDIAREQFPQIPALYYKHIVGQYDSCSSLALAIGASLLREQHIPEVLYWNTIDRTSTPKTILIYNQYRGVDHALILIRAC